MLGAGQEEGLVAFQGKEHNLFRQKGGEEGHEILEMMSEAKVQGSQNADKAFREWKVNQDQIMKAHGEDSKPMAN